MSETGTIPDPQSLFEENSSLRSFFATWSGDFITDGKTNGAEHINGHNPGAVLSVKIDGR